MVLQILPCWGVNTFKYCPRGSGNGTFSGYSCWHFKATWCHLPIGLVRHLPLFLQIFCLLLVSFAAIAFPSMSVCELYWLIGCVIPSHQMCFVPPFSSSGHLLQVWLLQQSHEVCLAQAGDLIRTNWHSAVLVSFPSSYPYITKPFWIKRIFRNQKPSYV